MYDIIVLTVQFLKRHKITRGKMHFLNPRNRGEDSGVFNEDDRSKLPPRALQFFFSLRTIVIHILYSVPDPGRLINKKVAPFLLRPLLHQKNPSYYFQFF